MPEARIQGAYSSLLAFKPRQVLLKSQNMKQKKAGFTENPKDSSNTSKFCHDVLLLNSIFIYLQKRGFSKTLECFSSESDVKNIDSADPSLDLEEVCLTYMSMCNHEAITVKSQQQEAKMDVIVKHVEIGKKKKKVSEKSGDKSVKAISSDTNNVSKSKKSVGVNDQIPDLEVKSKKTSDSFDHRSEEVEQVSAELANGSAIDMEKGLKAKTSIERSGDIQKSKQKEKKTINNTDQVNSELFSKSNSKVKKEKRRKDGEYGTEEFIEKCDVVCDLQLVESTEKCMDKKKKRKKLDSESFGLVDEQLESKGKKRKDKSLDSELLSIVDENTLFDSKMDDIQIAHEKVPQEEKKSSHKRKCKESGKKDSQSIGENIKEKSKCRKTQNHGENGSDKLAEPNGNTGNIGEIQVQNTPEKNLSTLRNDSFDKNDTTEKSILEKSYQKQSNGSVMSKTMKAFQRVKVDEVDFSDKRLQDNSYWAKGGSESGYGAKAQEVLGQVRGRDFRHQKTKKKRGSYRGGQIDLESHSIKFNNFDED